MARYEVLQPLGNGKKAPHAIGAKLTLDAEDAETRRLVKLKAIRLLSDDDASADDDDGAELLSLLAYRQKFRDEISQNTVPKLDTMLANLSISLDGSPNKAAKVEALVDDATRAILASTGRDGLIALAAASGFADLQALELDNDASEDDIRDALMRHATAKAE